MQNNDTRESLGSKLESFGAAPSEGLWASIAGSLDGKKKRKAAIWWWLGAAAVTIVGVGIVSTNMSSQKYTVDHNSSIISASENGLIVDQNVSDTEENTILNTVEWMSASRESDQAIFLQNRSHSNMQNTDGFVNENTFGNDAVNASQEEENQGGFASNGGTKNQLNGENQGAATVQQDAIEQKNVLKENQEDDHSIGNERTDPISEEYEGVNIVELLETVDRLEQLPLSKLDFNYVADVLTPIASLKQPQNRWELGFSVNRFRSLQGESGYQVESPTVDTTTSEYDLVGAINNNYVVKVVRPIGLKFYAGYQFTRRLRIVSGICAEYSVYRYANPQNANVSGSSTTSFGVIPARLTTIGLPIGLEIDFIKRRRFQMTTGLSLLNEFPILETYLPVYDTNYDGPQSNNRKFISGYNMGFSFNLKTSVYLTEKMRIHAGPTMRYYQSQKSTSTLNLPKRDFWLGGSIGLIWELGK